MAAVSIIVLLLMICGIAQPQQPSEIAPGSSLSPTTHPWLSPSKRFAFGFYRQGSTGFAVGIWLDHKGSKTVVWTAVRDHQPVTSNAKLEFTKDSMLVLIDEQGRQTLIANATDSVSHASMLDSGNFVLYSRDSKLGWQSFEHPTDTILGGQTLLAGGQLFSSLNKEDHSTGRFLLKMQDDGNLVLYPANTGDTPLDAYWESDTFGDGSKFHLCLNNSGSLLIINDTTSDTVKDLYECPSLDTVGELNECPSLADNSGTIYRATLDFNGFFRLYSHTDIVSTLWTPFTDPCQVKTFCGFNSYCTFNDTDRHCYCLLGTDFADPNDLSRGCERNFSEVVCTGGKENEVLYNITTMENMNWGDPPYIEAKMATVEECSRSCLEDCDCEAALFKSGSCAKQSLPLRYVRIDTKQNSIALLKQNVRSIEGSNKTNPIQTKPVMVGSQTTTTQILFVTLGFIALSCVALAIFGLFTFKSRVLRYRRLLENGNLGPSAEVTLRMFSYNELKKATNGFKEEIGKGSFGAVYKGALHKGRRLVAVKRLEKLIEEGEREFRAEMRAIGRTHHRNLVRLLGYCAEDSKRLLVYEYMSNGSLADLLFRTERRPDWNERVRIAREVARGILYLHEECEAPVIHCDIKPQNILMDDFWTAKISDFGLAKFLLADQTRTFTGIRGTRGYLAPEWHKNTPISVRVDVYSYGIVLLEIVCCRRSLELNVSNEEEIYLPTWVYKCFVAKELDKIVRWEEVDKSALENTVKVALWCIQDDPAFRPSMKSVLLMLEGIADVLIPPNPPATST